MLFLKLFIHYILEISERSKKIINQLYAIIYLNNKSIRCEKLITLVIMKQRYTWPVKNKKTHGQWKIKKHMASETYYASIIYKNVYKISHYHKKMWETTFYHEIWQKLRYIIWNK